MLDRAGWRTLLAVGFCLGLIVGCGSSSELTSVEGVVTLDGAPLPKVQVLFFEPGGGPETNFIAVTDDDGRFKLATLNEQVPGAKPGKYMVNLRTGFAGPELKETDPIPTEMVPPKYQEFEYEIPPGGDTNIQFDLKSR